MDETEVEQFGQLFARFLERVVHAAPTRRGGAESLADRLERHLGGDPVSMSVVTERFAPFELATVQVALDAMGAAGGATYELIGIGGQGVEHSSFAEVLQMSRYGGYWVAAPEYASVQVSADEERTCVALGVFLLAEGERRLAVLMRAGSEHGRGASLEVLTAEVGQARDWLERLRVERAARNLLRGQVLSFAGNAFQPGTGPVTFHRRPTLSREDVVLPDDVLDRVERQIAGIARYRDRLRAEGRHLKRGVLLYGPPGTGKTHTVRWLTSLLSDFTVVLLAGHGIAAVHTACALARTLQPALIVLEDVDLVARDRDFTPDGNPLLFTVLDQMDGLSADADVAFLLTTNRADLLEPALAQRPGRVDLAVEVSLPDEDARRRLLEMYGRGLALTDSEMATFLEGSVGVPASFVKEVVRRATLLAAEAGTPTTGEHVLAAAEEIVSAQEALTRHSLGAHRDLVGVGPDGMYDPEAGPQPGVFVEDVGAQPSAGGYGWTSYAPLPGRAYRSELSIDPD